MYVAFSGGKDSTVLLHLVRRLYSEVPALFSNTGLEYPELQTFVRGVDNTTIVRPKMLFTDVITTYGYPLISKEVSEAIYYARKLGGGQDNTSQTIRTPWGTGGLETLAKRTELLGQHTEQTRQQLRAWKTNQVETAGTWGGQT